MDSEAVKSKIEERIKSNRELKKKNIFKIMNILLKMYRHSSDYKESYQFLKNILKDNIKALQYENQIYEYILARVPIIENKENVESVLNDLQNMHQRANHYLLHSLKICEEYPSFMSQNRHIHLWTKTQMPNAELVEIYKEKIMKWNLNRNALYQFFEGYSFLHRDLKSSDGEEEKPFITFLETSTKEIEKTDEIKNCEYDCYPIRENGCNKIAGIQIIVPPIDSVETMLINIKVSAKAYEMYPLIGTNRDITCSFSNFPVHLANQFIIDNDLSEEYVEYAPLEEIHKEIKKVSS